MCELPFLVLLLLALCSACHNRIEPRGGGEKSPHPPNL